MIDNLKDAIEKYKDFAECETGSARVLREHGCEKDAKYFEETAENDKKIVALLTELQERREADKWRPISEPPKEHDYYLVTCEFGVASATDIALFYPDRKGEKQWSLNYVTAWKPLPEPYESEAEE